MGMTVISKYIFSPLFARYDKSSLINGQSRKRHKLRHHHQEQLPCQHKTKYNIQYHIQCYIQHKTQYKRQHMLPPRKCKSRQRS